MKHRSEAPDWTGGVEIKADQLEAESGYFEGYGAIFGEEDKGGDIIEPGAFMASLAHHRASGSMPALLMHHDPSAPVGVWEEMEEDRRGLRVRGRLLMEIEAGRDAFALLKARALRGLSIGYRTIRSEGGAKSSRILQEVDLWEVSLVTFPMQPRAGVDSLKFADLDTDISSLAAAAAWLQTTAAFSEEAARKFVERIQTLDQAERTAEADRLALKTAAQRLIHSLT